MKTTTAGEMVWTAASASAGGQLIASSPVEFTKDASGRKLGGYAQILTVNGSFLVRAFVTRDGSEIRTPLFSSGGASLEEAKTRAAAKLEAARKRAIKLAA